ncbi:MerR family transcriptional regulator [Luteolibacter sp. AS25]|uniref:MerR family transcriptional regulator n=1 Tax=Luteolibacter sp. AS25 TaxID=3135776 RepID=UPI00398AC282
MKTITPDPQLTHPLETAITLTGSSRRKILFYCQKGIVTPIRSETTKEWHFDEETLLRLRHIETLRQQHRMNWLAIQTIIHLTNEVEVLRQELRRR